MGADLAALRSLQKFRLSHSSVQNHFTSKKHICTESEFNRKQDRVSRGGATFSSLSTCSTRERDGQVAATCRHTSIANQVRATARYSERVAGGRPAESPDHHRVCGLIS